ncbi:hypothetical protein PsYK624_120850 [Phanerochaete sordida]|uniref:Uncharacterized protein n=1 Tax=Phanerochaete sordida TaxID=48140 RepID=A0A9P3GKD9_9APHY|nr:hypothetical protein PsYK624_120850 [Phanerochaete sordida]
MSRKRKARDAESIDSEKSVPTRRGPLDAPSTRHGPARNGRTTSTAAPTSQAATMQRYPSQSSTAGEDDESLSRGRTNGHSNGRARGQSNGQNGDAGHHGHSGTPQPLAHSDAGSPHGSQPVWRVQGYVSEHSQSPGPRPRAGSVVVQRSLSGQGVGAEGNQSLALAGGYGVHQVQQTREPRNIEPALAPGAELITVLINDNRYLNEHGIAEIFIPTFKTDSAIWVDARDVVAHLQHSPGKVDGPARVSVMRGGWKQWFLRVEPDGTMISGMANLKVEENNTLKIHIDYIPRYAPHLNQHPVPSETFDRYDERSWAPRAEPERSMSSMAAPRGRAEPPRVHVQQRQASHTSSQSTPPSNRKRRHVDSGEGSQAASSSSHAQQAPSNAGSGRPSSSSTTARMHATHVPQTSRQLANNPSVARQPSMNEPSSPSTLYPASTSQGSMVLHPSQSEADTFAPDPEPEPEPRQQSTAPDSPVQQAFNSPVTTEPALSPVTHSPRLVSSPALPQRAPSPAPPARMPSPQSSPESSPPPSQAKKPRYDDESDSDDEVQLRAGVTQIATSAVRFTSGSHPGSLSMSVPATNPGSAPAPPPQSTSASIFTSTSASSHASAFSLASLSTPVSTSAPTPASSSGGFGKFAGAGSTGGFAGFGAPTTGLGAGTSQLTRNTTVGASGASGTLARAAGFGAASGGRDVVTLYLQRVLRAEPGYDAFLRARTEQLGIAQQVPHWRYLKGKLEAYVGKAVPADVPEAGGMIISKEQVTKAFGVPLSRADEYVEALSLTALYGPRGSRTEDKHVATIYDEPCAVASNVQLSRYLKALRDAQTLWETQHGAAR